MEPRNPRRPRNGQQSNRTPARRSSGQTEPRRRPSTTASRTQGNRTRATAQPQNRSRSNNRARHEAAQQQERNRLLLIIAIGVVSVVLLVLGLVLIFGGNKETPKTGVLTPSSSVFEEASPSPSLSEEPSIFSNVEHLRNLAKDVPLYNFDHPNTAGEPTTLVGVSDVIGDLATVNEAGKLLDSDAANALKAMLTAAKEDGITTFIINSAYRSKTTQQSLWDNRVSEDPTYGENPYENPVKVMRPDASEHCAGLAVDILCESVPSGTSAFADTTEGKWLADNSYKYGFILRYPEDKQSKTGVIFEPWHFRYVGEELASAIFESGLCMEEFYENLEL